MKCLLGLTLCLQLLWREGFAQCPASFLVQGCRCGDWTNGAFRVDCAETSLVQAVRGIVAQGASFTGRVRLL